MGYPLDNIVKINEFIQAGGLGNVDFGKTALMALSAELQGGKQFDKKTWKVFSTSSDLIEYFADTTETYKAASRWFAAGGSDLMVYLRDESNDSAVTSAADAKNKKWFYGMVFTKDVTNTESDVIALADWCDANKSYLYMASDNPDVADPSKNTDIASVMLAKGNRRIAIGYRDSATTAKDSSQIYFMIAIAALLSKVNFSGVATVTSPFLKALNGVIGEELTTTAYTALEDKKVTFCTNIEEGDQVDYSKVVNPWSMSSKNETIMDVYNTDALVSYLKVAEYNEMQKTKLFGISLQGMNRAIITAETMLSQFFTNGALAAGYVIDPITGESVYCEKGYYVVTKPEDVFKLSDADKKERKLYPLNIIVIRQLEAFQVTIDLTIQ